MKPNEGGGGVLERNFPAELLSLTRKNNDTKTDGYIPNSYTLRKGLNQGLLYTTYFLL